MDQLVQLYSPWELAGIIYLMLCLAKTILAYASLPAAIRAYRAAHEEQPVIVIAALFIVLIPAMMVVYAPVALVAERMGFFTVYSNREVESAIIAASRR